MPTVPPRLFALGAGVVQHVLAPDHRTGLVRKAAAVSVGGASMSLIGGSLARFRSNHTTVEPF